MELQESTELQSLKEIVRFAPSVYEDHQTRNYDDFIRIVCNSLKNAVDKICEDITEAAIRSHGDKPADSFITLAYPRWCLC